MNKSYEIRLYTHLDHYFLSTASTITEALKMKATKDKQYMQEYREDDTAGCFDSVVIEIVPIH